MTWIKLGQEFNDECAAAGLSDAEYRTHCEALGWLYRVEAADMKIPKHLIGRFASSDSHHAAIAELVARGFWTESADAFTVIHHGDVFRQSLAAQQAKRALDKKHQAAKRKRDRQKSDTESGTDTAADVRADTDSQTDNQQLEGGHKCVGCGWQTAPEPGVRCTTCRGLKDNR